MKHASRRFAALIALLALLFAQAVISAHACGMLHGAKYLTSVAPQSAQDFDCCDGDAPGGDLVCDSHCQQGNQAPERAQLPAVMPIVGPGFEMPVPLGAAAAPQTLLAVPPDLVRDTQPPIPIRNCCFRI